MAKSRQKIDASKIEERAFTGCTLSEMAIFLDCSEDIFYGRFLKAIKEGIMRRNIFLRRQQLDQAMNGNAAALNWCLAQTDEQLKDLDRHQKESVESLSREELIEQLTEVRDSADRTLRVLSLTSPRFQSSRGWTPICVYPRSSRTETSAL